MFFNILLIKLYMNSHIILKFINIVTENRLVEIVFK